MPEARELPVVQLHTTAWTRLRGIPRRHVEFAALGVLSLAWFWQPLTTVIGRSLQGGDGYEHYSHIILLPFISGYLLYLNRRTGSPALPRAGRHARLTLAAAVALFAWLTGSGPLVTDPEHRLSVAMLGLVVTLAGIAALSYGVPALRV